MAIQIDKTYNLNSRIIKYLEKVSENLILFTIEVEADTLMLDSRPLHWRYDFGDFPPLDISFDSETGLIKEITIFINKENIRYGYMTEDVNLMNLKGFPSISLDVLEKHKYYYDEVCEMEIYLSDSTLSISRLGRIVHKKLLVNEELTILLDEENKFVGLRINNLSIDNVELFK